MPLALLLAAPGLAFAQEEAELVEQAMDSALDPAERAQAVRSAGRKAAMREPPRQGPLREALPELLGGLASKAADAGHAKLIRESIRASNHFAPLEGAGQLLKPFLMKGGVRVQVSALEAVGKHKPAGAVPVLTKMLEETLADPKAMRLELSIIEAAAELRGGGSVLGVALAKSRHKNVRLAAANGLGEVTGKVGLAELKAASGPDGKDEDVPCAAVLALAKRGSNAGLEGAVTRLERRPGSLKVYRTICRAALREEVGFLDVPPESYFAAGRGKRKQIVEAVRAWWDGKGKQRRADLLGARLKEKGIALPADRNSKEAVTALIRGLDVEPRSLRYAALAEVRRLLGREALPELDEFQVINNQLAQRFAMRRHEPAGGFRLPKDQQKLRAEQKERAKVIAKWWAKAQANAEWNGQRWVVR